MCGEVTIVPAAVEDAGELLTLQRAAYVTEAQLYGDPFLPPLTQTLAELAAELASVTCLKAVSGGRVIGTVRARPDGTTWRIGRLAVAPDRQGRGVATALLAAVEDAAGAAVRTYALFTGAASLANLRLYARLGYAEVRREQTPTGPGLVHLEKPRPCGSA